MRIEPGMTHPGVSGEGRPLRIAMDGTARECRLLVQMGFLLRYTAAVRQIHAWVRAGLLGEVFAVRGHMSTTSTRQARERARYAGGIAFQLAPHLVDQAVSLFGGAREGVRPERVTSLLRNDATPGNPAHADKTLAAAGSLARARPAGGGDAPSRGGERRGRATP